MIPVAEMHIVRAADADLAEPPARRAGHPKPVHLDHTRRRLDEPIEGA